MSLKEKFFPENRLGLNRFWNFSRGGIDNFRTGLTLIGLVMVYSASITLADGPK